MKLILSAYARKQRILRQRGWDDCKAGRDIMRDFPGQGERERAEWELGWYLAKQQEDRPNDLKH